MTVKGLIGCCSIINTCLMRWESYSHFFFKHVKCVIYTVYIFCVHVCMFTRVHVQRVHS